MDRKRQREKAQVHGNVQDLHEMHETWHVCFNLLLSHSNVFVYLFILAVC